LRLVARRAGIAAVAPNTMLIVGAGARTSAKAPKGRVVAYALTR
jgi:hypothetical protein